MTTGSDELAGVATNDAVTAAENPELAENLDSHELDLNLTATSAAAEEEKLNDGKTSESTVTSSVGDESQVSDIQKKIQRAERFGMPVLLSEEEKRNSRAERFGTAPKLQSSEASEASEDLKRKSRAERFGIPVPPTPSDEEAKKKARLARFGGPAKDESVEEDKRKARAIRFSKPVSGAPSQVNGEGNIEQAAITGKTV